jgi:replicative DNA helicase
MAAENARQVEARVPPQDTEAEEAVLGAMLINPNAIPVVTDVLSRDDFWRESHAIVFDAVRGLYADNNEVDVVTVSAELERQGKLERIGGRDFVHALAEAVPAATAAGHYAEIVREHSALRALIQVGNEIAEMGYKRPDDVAQLLDRAEQRLFAVAQQRRVSDFLPIRQIVHESFDRIQSSQEGKAHEGVQTGFKDIDDLILGLFPSNLIVLAARPSMGKTSLALNIAHNVGVDQKVPTAIFSLEMSGLELGDRFLSGAARVSTHKFRNPRLLRQDEMDKLVRASAQLTEAPIFVDDSAGLTMFELRSKARRLHDKHGLGLLIIDYLQLMVGDTRAENRQQEVAGISRSLKQLARELKVPVLAVSQLNRGPEKQTGGGPRKPQLSDLRECLAGDTLVTVSSTGERVPIRDLAGETDIPVWTLHPDLRIGSRLMANVWRTGTRPVMRLRLASGRTITATANHPFLTVAGWTQVDALRERDHIAVARRTPSPADPLDFADDEVVLLAHLIGDGCLSRDPIYYCSADDACLRTVEDAARRFGVTTKRTPGRGVTYVHFPMIGVASRHNPSRLYDWLRCNELYGKRAPEKRVPRWVHRLDNRRICLFLRHLWATDGSVTVRRAGRARIYYASTSRGLADDVQALLLRIGISSRLRHVPSSLHRDGWTVDVDGRPHQMAFLSRISVHGAREVLCEQALAALDKTTGNPNVDVVPSAVWTQVRTAMRTHGITSRELAHHLRMSYCGSSLYKSGLSRSRMARVAEKVPEERFRHLAESDVLWDRIVAIEHAGETDVYDARVPGTHSFLADDVVSHNSGAIEQDADLVLFIHRDPTDETKKGVVDIVVAKHRNGPVGTRPLAFVEEYTQFRTMARSDDREPF